jgi:hypothetical protein
MATDPTRLYRGQGIFSIAERDPAGNPLGFLDMGNVTELMLMSAIDAIEHRESRTGKQFKDKRIERLVDGRMRFTAESTTKEALARYIYGTATLLATATITNEIVISYLGRKSKLSRMNLSTWTSLTNAAGTITLSRDVNNQGAAGTAIAVAFDNTTDTFTAAGHGLTNGNRLRFGGTTLPTGITAGTNYFVIAAAANTFQVSATFGGTVDSGTTDGAGVVATPQYDYSVNLGSGVIDIYPTANITEGDSLRANYAAGTSEKISAFTKTNAEVYCLFEGLNTAEDDNPVVVEVYKVRFDPAEEWSLIGDDFNSFSVTGEVLYDATKPDNLMDGRFWRETQRQPA